MGLNWRLGRFQSYVLAFFFLLPVNVSATGILVYGDSISAGYKLPEQSGWVELLKGRLASERLPFSVINLSISGETTSGGLTRLPEALSRHHPQLLIIELGANDGLRGTPLNAIRYNLEQMVKLAQAEDVHVLLLGMRIPPNYGRPYTDAFYQLFAQIADKYSLAYVPFLLEGVGGHPELMQNDGLHPNEQAQVKLLDNLWPTLLPVLTELQP